MKIAVLGGTGKQGSGLAMRWARVGHEVLIGSRTAEKATQAAADLSTRIKSAGRITGLDNAAAAALCEVAVLSVPYSSQLAILESVKPELTGKLLISVVAPLKPPRVSRVWQPEAGSAALEAQAYLGDTASVVIAFQNISSDHLIDPEHEIDSDVLICGDHKADKALAMRLTADVGMRPVDAGPLANASVVEGLTAVLIGINIRNKIAGAGIRITGLEGWEAG